MDKAQLRRRLRMRLHAMNDDERRQKNRAIHENLIDSIDWHSIHRVSCYRSKANLDEVDTIAIITHIQDSWPDIELDLIEPNQQAILPQNDYDLIIVPVLGFDDQCNRLGRGGGWYDRFLSTQDSAKKIGIAFTIQHVNLIPVEDYDVELDDIITEN